LATIRALVRRGVEVLVVDHDSGADRTAETLGRALGHRRGDSGVAGLRLAVLEQLIRSPERLNRALTGQDRDADELRKLRDEVRALSSLIDDLLEPPPESG
jgi:hypothetical protein